MLRVSEVEGSSFRCLGIGGFQWIRLVRFSTVLGFWVLGFGILVLGL